MRRTKIKIVYPFRGELTKEGIPKRIFDESQAGIDITFRMTIQEAEKFAEEFTATLEIAKDFIQKQKTTPPRKEES